MMSMYFIMIASSATSKPAASNKISAAHYVGVRLSQRRSMGDGDGCIYNELSWAGRRIFEFLYIFEILYIFGILI